MSLTAPAPERETCTTCERPFTNGQRSGTCSRCRQARPSSAAQGSGSREPKQNVPAYLSDELNLSEADQVGVLDPISLDALLRCVERRRDLAFNADGSRRKDGIPKGYEWDGIIETAWALPLWQYRQVEEAVAEIESRAREAKRPRDTAQA
jgi:hypothetical protein